MTDKKGAVSEVGLEGFRGHGPGLGAVASLSLMDSCGGAEEPGVLP